MRLWMSIGAISAALAVVAGAFGGHALKKLLSPEMQAIFEVGNRYHMYHSLGLLLVALAAAARPNVSFNAAGWALLVGIVLFSGSLYALALSGVRALGMITPLGGVSFIAGWALLAWTAWKHG